MKKNKKYHRLNINLTDGQYYTLQNLASFFDLSISDYVKKSCRLLYILPNEEFIPVWNDEEEHIELIPDTPESVQKGYLTLGEYYELEEEYRTDLSRKGAEEDGEED